MDTNPIRILALDLSLSSTGYSVMDCVDNEITVLKVGHINNKRHAKQPHGFRLYQVFGKLKKVMDEYEPDIVVKERGFSKGHKSTQALFKVAGVVDLLAHIRGVSDIAEIAPLTVKSLVGGNGRASKEDVEKGLTKFIVELPDFENDDESDAVAVGVSWLLQNKYI